MSGAEGTRTPDPHTASVVRYQLRHSPKLPEKVIKHPGTDLIELRSPIRPPNFGRAGGSGQADFENAVLSGAVAGAQR